MKVKYSYHSIYNTRPDEMFGMGKESLIVSGETEINKFFELMEHNSSLKHTNCLQWIIGTDEYVEMEEWKSYLGQPMFFITDLKMELIDGDW